MSTYVLIHGASSDSWYWHRVVPELRRLGHDVIAPDLPVDDGSAGLAAYTDAVVAAVGDRRDLIVVAQSLGGFVGPLVCQRVPVELLVLVAAMVPAPGETGGHWWVNTGHAALIAATYGETGSPDAIEMFFHDVSPEVTAEAMARGERDQSGTPFAEPWPLPAWPAVPTRFLLCRDDRLFPAGFQRRVVKERLGITADELDGGHLPALSRPQELVARLEAYRTALSLANED